MMATKEQQGNTSSPNVDVDVNGGMIPAINKLQSNMEMLKSENESPKKELSTVISKTKQCQKLQSRMSFES